jgi:hypothetical protein
MTLPRSPRATLLLGLVLLGSGCASSPVVGTWQGRDDSSAAFTFGSVSFVDDKTFTAEARYGDKIRVQSGTWSVRGDVLDLASPEGGRTYSFRVAGDELVVTDPKTGHALTLDRLRR